MDSFQPSLTGKRNGRYSATHFQEISKRRKLTVTTTTIQATWTFAWGRRRPLGHLEGERQPALNPLERITGNMISGFEDHQTGGCGPGGCCSLLRSKEWDDQYKAFTHCSTKSGRAYRFWGNCWTETLVVGHNSTALKFLNLQGISAFGALHI